MLGTWWAIGRPGRNIQALLFRTGPLYLNYQLWTFLPRSIELYLTIVGSRSISLQTFLTEIKFMDLNTIFVSHRLVMWRVILCPMIINDNVYMIIIWNFAVLPFQLGLYWLGRCMRISSLSQSVQLPLWLKWPNLEYSSIFKLYLTFDMCRGANVINCDGNTIIGNRPILPKMSERKWC